MDICFMTLFVLIGNISPTEVLKIQNRFTDVLFENLVGINNLNKSIFNHIIRKLSYIVRDKSQPLCLEHKS